MGYHAHHTIVVTAWNEKAINAAHKKAEQIFPEHEVTPITDSRMNSFKSFCIVPDGSKEGWSDSEVADGQRRLFVSWINRQRWGDGSSPFTWAEVLIGNDEGQAEIVRHSGEVEIGDDYDGPHEWDLVD